MVLAARFIAPSRYTSAPVIERHIRVVTLMLGGVHWCALGTALLRLSCFNANCIEDNVIIIIRY